MLYANETISVLRMQHELGTDPAIVVERRLKVLKAHVRVTLDRSE